MALTYIAKGVFRFNDTGFWPNLNRFMTEKGLVFRNNDRDFFGIKGVSVLFISFLSVMCWSNPLACSQPLEFISLGGFSVKFEAIRIR